VNSQSIQLYLSPPHECSYLPERESRNLFVDPDFRLTPESYNQLLEQGFRRSGNFVYRPHCDTCSACVASRVPTPEFQPKRSQRRVLKANQDISISSEAARFQDEHFQLYQRYTASRHEDGEMQNSTEEQYIRFLTTEWCDTEFLEFRLDGRLVAVAVTDILPRALSSVYTFFDPELGARSLGVMAILSQLELARQRGLPWLYLGYWIGECKKMSYKAEYRPLELFTGQNWQQYDRNEPIPVLSSQTQ
jgi:arginine-tRNA-protein transferase